MKLKAEDFLDILRDEGILYSVRKGHIWLSGENEELVAGLRKRLADNPRFEAGVISQIKKERRLTPEEYIHELEVCGLSYTVSKGITIPRVELHGNNEHALNRCRAILASNPEIEAWLIVHEATKDDVLLDMIRERAYIRWSEGLSDSPYLAVLGNFSATEEAVEYTDSPDMEQVLFARSVGIAEADIMDREKYPSAWIKLKPKTDFEAELEKYR